MSVQSSLLPMALPELRAELAQILEPLCVSSTPELLTELPAAIQAHLTHVEAELRRNEFLDIDSARKIADLLFLLLDAIEEYEPDQQRLIVGAARYFTSGDDASPDTESLLGFDDDIEVINWMLDQIGHADMKIEI